MVLSIYPVPTSSFVAPVYIYAFCDLGKMFVVFISCFPLLASGQIPTEPLNAPAVGPVSTDASLNFAGSSLSRQARRLYVGGIPFGMTDVSAYLPLWETTDKALLFFLGGKSLASSNTRCCHVCIIFC